MSRSTSKLRATGKLLAPLVVAIANAASVASGPAGQAAEQPVRERLDQQSPARGAAASRQAAPATSSDPNDFYYYNGAPVRLDRSLTEVVARFKPAAPEESLVRELSASARLGREVRSEGRAFRILTVAPPANVEPLLAKDDVEFVASVFYHPETGTRMLPTDEIIVKLKPGTTREELAGLAAALGLTVVKPMWRTSDEWVLRLDQPQSADPLERSRALYETGRLEWAEPDFLQDVKKLGIPNDPRFGQQWHLNNTGQGGGTPGADIKAPAAWDIEPGSAAITIAVIDDGVQKTHEDLAANIFTNPGEIPGNSIDDDGNGYVDDVNGWDFNDNDNDASPMDVLDNHGTAVAGVAAARGNNAIGVSGSCRNCKILPVKIFSPDFAGDAAVANAIRYASTLADVLNNSWGGSAPTAVIQSAIQFANTNGRGGRGSVVLFASGNSASGYSSFTLSGFPAGTYTFRWEYVKDANVSQGADTAWLGWVQFPGGELVDFQSGGLPPGWTTGGSGGVPWSVVTDAAHADEGGCFTRAAKAGLITHGQLTFLQVTKFVPAGSLVTHAFASSEAGYDGIQIKINGVPQFDPADLYFSGVPSVTTSVGYPAAYPESIAVGSSSNFDCRSAYSQFGPELAFVAPSNGGPLNLAIETTDRMGASGYDGGNYTQAAGASGFGGTSSATPLASGVAGLILSRNPSLTRAQVLQTMQNTADKVGPQAYVAGRNDRYGFGRLDAQAALAATSPAVLPTVAINDVTLAEGNAGSTTFTFNVSLSTTAWATTTVNWATAPNSASTPSDFVTASGMVTFNVGQSLKTVNVTVNGDSVFEGNETFFVNLSAPSGATIGDGQGVGTITNDDPMPITINDVTLAEGNAGPTVFTFNVSLAAPAPATITVDYITFPNTATPPSDYATTFGTLTFNVGESTKPVNVTVNGEALFETNEIFFVNLSAPSGAVIADSQGVGTIANDDAMPSLAINDVTQAETNSGTTTFGFTVTLAPASGVQATVNYATANVTAMSGSDYVMASGMLTFDPGQTTKPVNVTVNGEGLFEPNETFFVNLSMATNATISDSQGIGTITNDDIPPARVFVSVLGADTNDCSNVATPCRTLGAAIGQVATDGEVIVIKSGSYAGATIAKGVKIDAAAGVVAFSAQPITVNSGAGTTVVLRGLTLKAVTAGTGNGLLLQSAGTVFVENCVIDGWDIGIRQQGAAELFVKDSTIRGNTTGIYATTGQNSIDNSRLSNNGNGLALAIATASVRGSTLSGNTTGIYADSSSSVTVDKCQVANNGSGITLPMSSLSTLRLANSVVSGNGIGLENLGGTLEVNGTNLIRGNTLDTTGTITTTGRQ